MPDTPAPSSAPSPEHGRGPLNTGAALDLVWVRAADVDDAVAARSSDDPARRATLAADAEVSRLLEAIRAIDLTTLSGDDTAERVRALCARARSPLPEPIARALPPGSGSTRTAAVCIYHHFLPVAREALAGSGIPAAVVSAGFPAGLSPLRQRIDEVGSSVAAGAQEIDAVINRSHALAGDWEALYGEVRAFREASGPALLKVILATGELGSATTIARTARVCMLAGADFIKTSTGKEAVNATFPAGLVMLESIRDYRERTGQVVGFKAAGGIRTPAQALEWMRLVEEELGTEALSAARFRLGASGLLDAIVRRLEELAGLGGARSAAPGVSRRVEEAEY